MTPEPRSWKKRTKLTKGEGRRRKAAEARHIGIRRETAKREKKGGRGAQF